jgi:putative nucleotidyltransferase with HDIG domain
MGAIRHLVSLSTAKLLVVDDEPEIVTFIREFLLARGYDVLGLSDPREVAAQLDTFQPDLCVFDFRMPHKTGADLLEIVKKKDPKVEVVFLTAQDEACLAVDLMKRGAADYLLKPVEINPLLVAIGRALEHRRLIIENEEYRLHLEQLVMEKTQALNRALTSLNHVHSATLDALSMALDFRDQSTSGHSRRVADLTTGAAMSMGIKDSALIQIEHGALLHDIGKLKIPDSILWKPTRLTEEEWITMRRHAEYGYQFLSNVEFLKGAAEIVYSHHEKYDGTGYPRGLRGDEIPFGARVFMIVDTVDAMIYKRPYNSPVSFNDAAAEVRRCSGTQFDPSVIEPTLTYLSKQIPKTD